MPGQENSASEAVSLKVVAGLHGRFANNNAAAGAAPLADLEGTVDAVLVGFCVSASAAADKAELPHSMPIPSLAGFGRLVQMSALQWG